jgi:hypothetical protein
MSELSGREMKNIAKTFVKHSMGVGRKKGGYEAVRILYNRTDPSCEKFAQKVEEECWTVGRTRFCSGTLLKDKNWTTC